MKQIYSGTQKQIYGTTTETPYIFLTKTGISHIIILTAISLFILAPMTNALEFQLISPAEANAKEPFSVSINAETSDIYDVKIFIENPDKKVVSEIYNDAWKNGFYYIKSIFPEKKEFKVKSKEFGNYQLCARLRKTGKTSFDEKCNNIEITESQNTSEEQLNINKEESLPEENPINNTNNKQMNKTKEIKKDNTQKNLKNINYPQSSQDEKIILIKNYSQAKEIQEEIITKKEKLRNRIIYAFLAFTVVIIILLALKKL